MIIDREVKVAKELDDVAILLVQLVDTIKQGKELTEVVDELVNALNGFDQVDDELAANRKVALQTIGSRLFELVDVILTKAPVEVEDPA